MADEFQNRKDIEKLYDLVYARTSDSPVAQKSELDTLMEEIQNTYATNDALTEMLNQMTVAIEELWEAIRDPPALTSISLSTSSSSILTSETATLTVTAYDQYSEGMSGASIDLYNGSTKITTLTTSSDGSQTYTFTPSTTGTFTFKAVNNSIESSTVSITVTNAPPVLSSLTISSNKASMRTGESATLTVTAKDQYNDGMSGVAVDIYNGSSKLTTVTTGNGGTQTYTFTPSSASTYTLKAKKDSLESSTVSITVTSPVLTTVTISPSSSIIQTGGTSVLTVTALDDISEPMASVSLDLYQDGTVVDSLTTDGNGEATYTYTGTGIGDTVFYATDGTVSSSNTTIEDCLFYGIDTSAFIIPSNTTFSSDGSKITATTSTSGEKIVYFDHTFANADNWVFETEIAQIGTGQSMAVVWNDNSYYGGIDKNDTSKYYSYMGSTVSQILNPAVGDKYIVRRENGVTTVTAKGTQIDSKTTSHKSSFKIGYFINSGRTQYYKNIKVKLL